MYIVANSSGPGTGVDTYPRTATTLDDGELDDFSAAFGDLGVADAVDEPPTRAFRAAMNVPQLGLPTIDAADAAALEALHRTSAAMMVPKVKKVWSWKKGRGLGLTGETVGSSHVAALYGGACSSRTGTKPWRRRWPSGSPRPVGSALRPSCASSRPGSVT